MDSLERTVFVACREPKGGRSRVVRVDLYRRLRKGETQQEEEEGNEVNDEDAEAEEETDRWEALGGGGRGDIVRLDDSGQKAPSSSSSNNNQTKASEATQQVGTLSVPGRTYVLPSSPPAESSISSLHLSPLSSTLVLGTSSGQIHVLSLPSMQPIRVIVPLAGSTSISPGAQTLNLVKGFLRPVDLVSRSGSAGGSGKEEQIQPRAVAGQLSRTVLQQNSAGNTGTTVVMIKLNGVTSSDGRGEVEDLIDPPTRSSIGSSASQSAYSQNASLAFASDATSGSNSNSSSGHQNLQEENARLREQLARSIALNERIWEGVVDGVLGHRGGPASSALSAAPPGKSQHGGMEMEV
jgi:hypothetical protein